MLVYADAWEGEGGWGDRTDFQASQCIPMDLDAAADARCRYTLMWIFVVLSGQFFTSSNCRTKETGNFCFASGLRAPFSKFRNFSRRIPKIP